MQENSVEETDLVHSSHFPRLLCSVRCSTVGLHEQVLRTASPWWFVYVDITRGAGGKIGTEKMTRKGDEVNLLLTKEQDWGKGPFFSTSANWFSLIVRDAGEKF